jgi:uncharacterized sulfatase
VLVAVSDDQSWLHTSAAGDAVVKTPTFDRIAETGVFFSHAFSCAPSCTPSRNGLLTGQDIWRLEGGANLYNTLEKAKFPVYPSLLEESGYAVGSMRKAWGPGNFELGGWDRNPGGTPFKSFEEFFATVAEAQPFCFFFGSSDAHRPYEPGAGVASGMNADAVETPQWLPDVDIVRSDICDYYFEIQRFDRELGEVLAKVEAAGRLDNTLVIVTSDNGMPFPRAKATVYDSGVRMPLALSWPAQIPGGRKLDDLVSHADLAPTILEAAGLPVPEAMTGRSLLPALRSDKQGRVDPERKRVFSAMERHALCRDGGLGYPMRALRTEKYLYIRNFEPDRGPAGQAHGYGFGEIDDSPTKAFVLENNGTDEYGEYFRLACAKRPAEELYDVEKDWGQIHDVAEDPAYAAAKAELRAELDAYLSETGDPRLTGGPVVWDSIEFFGKGRL